MIELPLCDLIYLGTHLRYLKSVKEGWPIHGESYVLANIKELLAYFDQFSLNVTKRASFKILQIQIDLKKTDEASHLTGEQATKLVEEIRRVEPVLKAETAGMYSFLIREKRYSSDYLLKNPEKLISSGCFEGMSEFAKYDFSEGCKCIAFERPTAAAFHILRATEDSLKKLYFGYVKRNRVSILTWGNIENALRTKNNPKPKVDLLDQLKIIRKNFRNPTNHPEKIYQIDEVQSLLGVCVDVLERIVSDPKFSGENC